MVALSGENFLECFDTCELRVNTCHDNCDNFVVSIPANYHCIGAKDPSYTELNSYNYNSEFNKFSAIKRITFYNLDKTGRVSLLFDGRDPQLASDWLENQQDCTALKENYNNVYEGKQRAGFITNLFYLIGLTAVSSIAYCCFLKVKIRH